MYTPAPFVENDRAALQALIRDNGFGLLVTLRDGAPVVSHLPFTLDLEIGDNGSLCAHLARGNPQWRDFDGGEVLAIFQGPHGYISPRWYRPGNAVPTWNYAVVHAWGIPRIIDDPAEVRRQQDTLVTAYEGNAPDAWSLDGQPDEYVGGMMRGIVAFEIPIARLEGKFKLSQNRDDADRNGIVVGLGATGEPGDIALANLMAAHRQSTRPKPG